MTGDGNACALHGVELAPAGSGMRAQLAARRRPDRPNRGTLEIFTGGG